MCCSTFLIGQKSDNQKEPYIAFDQIIGKSSPEIYNGIQYIPQFRVKGIRHQFFKSAEFLKGNVAFNEQSYYDLSLKYDIYADELIIKNTVSKGIPPLIIDKSKISSFFIENHEFHKISFLTTKNKPIEGFCEVLFNSEIIVLYKKHGKKTIRKTEKQVFYEFKEDNNNYLKLEDSFIRLKNASQLISIFPEHKTSLNLSFKKHEALKNENLDRYMIAVLNDLSKVLIANTSLD